MKAKYFLFTPILLGFLYVMLISNASGPASAGNGNRTGSPGSNGTCSTCHSGGSFGTSISASVTDLLGNPVTSYIPGDSYYVEYQVSSTSGTPKYGFQSIMLTSTNGNAGNFDSTLTTNTQITTLSGKKLPEHSAKSTTGFFKVRWVAPAVGTGTVTLYYIGNAVNSNFSTTGDLATSSQSLTLTEVPVFTLSLTQGATINCFGDSTASITGSVINGLAPYTYTVNGGAPIGPVPMPSATVPNLGAGTYFVSVTDANGNGSTDSIVITQPTQIQSVVASTDETCYQMSNGMANVTVTGGTMPYSYLWPAGDTTSQVSNLAVGTHIVTITDSVGCTSLDTVIINGPTQLVVNPVISNPSCVGTSNGAVAISVSGGISPYSYLWSTGSLSPTISGLDTGLYMVTVTDANGCQVIDSYQLSSTNSPPTIALTTVEPTCYTSMNGSITATVSGGQSPYMYVWNTGDSTNSISNVDTGLYVLVVVDSTGCIAFDSVMVFSDNIGPLVNLGSDTVICSKDVGDFSLDAGMLVDNYKYLWNTADTTYSLTIFFSGNYWLEVTDTLGCIGSDTIQVDEQICTGIQDLFKTEEVKVYPLPAINFLNVEVEKSGVLTVFDLFGKKVLQINLEKGKTVLNTSELSKGSYILSFKNEKGIGIKKIMVL